MIIKTLVENTSISDDLGGEHGLSLYIETKRHKLLFDTGASPLFGENARKMQVDLAEVDLAAISHGHYDHGGGLGTFLNLNPKAKVYLHKRAFDKRYVHLTNGKNKYIGLDAGLLPNDRFIFVGDSLVIDEELELLQGVKAEKLNPSGNRVLMVEAGSELVPDDFVHEQNLFIQEDGNTLLIVGCGHKGIVNILEHFRLAKGYWPDLVIGGFHLSNPGSGIDEDPAVVAEIGDYLKQTQKKFYTGHCTGINSFNHLKSILGDQLEYLATGTQIVL